jgi:hypothetical protein
VPPSIPSQHHAPHILLRRALAASRLRARMHWCTVLNFVVDVKSCRSCVGDLRIWSSQVCLMLEEKTRWKQVQEVLRRPDFRSRVAAVDPAKVSPKAVAIAEQLTLNTGDLTPLLQVQVQGTFPAVIAAWTVAMLRLLTKQTTS